MARRVVLTDAILDAARGVVIERGLRGATVDAIAKAAEVPIGSIYHRFESVDELLAAVWLRAVRRSQQRALAVRASLDRPMESAVAVAVAMYDHCLAERDDTLLLDALRQRDLLAVETHGMSAEVATVNDEIDELIGSLARALFGRADRRGRDLVVLALVDLPHGFAQRELSSGVRAPARRARLPEAVRAVLEAG